MGYAAIPTPHDLEFEPRAIAAERKLVAVREMIDIWRGALSDVRTKCAMQGNRRDVKECDSVDAMLVAVRKLTD